MKVSRKGVPLCKVVDQSTGVSVEVSREVYRVVEACVATGFSGLIELEWNCGNVSRTRISQSGAQWLYTLYRGRKPEARPVPEASPVVPV